jgi:ATP-dependent DNA helicase RecG
MLKILSLLKDSSLSEAKISKKMKHTGRTGSLRKHIYKLLEFGCIELTIPEKLKSKNQKYRITEKGMKITW